MPVKFIINDKIPDGKVLKQGQDFIMNRSQYYSTLIGIFGLTKGVEHCIDSIKTYINSFVERRIKEEQAKPFKFLVGMKERGEIVDYKILDDHNISIVPVQSVEKINITGIIVENPKL